MKILLVGGGSSGPVSPLLAVADEIKKHHPEAKFLLVGTKDGPERQMAENFQLPFFSIASGKLRRYFSWKNFFTPFLMIAGFFQSWKIINNQQPGCIFGAGSFVQVPMVWAAWLKGVPVVIHQQDLVPSLANELCQLAAKKITVTFEPSLKSFSSSLGLFYKKQSGEKIILTGNPFREKLKEGLKARALQEFGLAADLPTLLVLGGGTGAAFLNGLVSACLPQLAKTVQIIHSTGKNKGRELKQDNYHPYEFINNMADAYAAADIVLARAGLSTLTELSNLKKLSIIVPMPRSHQELNAILLLKNEAAIVLPEDEITPENFINLIRRLLFAGQTQETLKNNMGKLMPHNATERIAEIVLKQAELN